MNNLKKILSILFISIFVLTDLFLAAQFYLIFKAQEGVLQSENEIFHVDAAIIFGAGLGEDGLPSPLMKQRLDAGVILYEAGVTDALVVSNTQVAAAGMREYLVAKGVDASVIEFDGKAYTTADSCRTERISHPDGRTVLFISQGYHLPRLIEQCRRMDVDGFGVPAEGFVKVKNELSSIQVYRIRTGRFLREAALSWLVILGIYK